MYKIRKYGLGLLPVQFIKMYDQAQFLYIEANKDGIELHTLERIEGDTSYVVIEMYKADMEVPSNDGFSRAYLGTVKVDGTIWHFFEKIRYDGKKFELPSNIELAS